MYKKGLNRTHWDRENIWGSEFKFITSFSTLLIWERRSASVTLKAFCFILQVCFLEAKLGQQSGSNWITFGCFKSFMECKYLCISSIKYFEQLQKVACAEGKSPYLESIIAARGKIRPVLTETERLRVRIRFSCLWNWAQHVKNPALLQNAFAKPINLELGITVSNYSSFED